MIHYAHTQPAYPARIGTFVALVATVAAMLLTPDIQEADWFPDAVLGGVAAVFVATLILFWSLTVRVTDEALEVWFGPGLVRKRVPLPEIVAVETARTSFWNGWGIHWTRRGWLFNASGFGAVLVRLRTGKSLLVGTDEPEALADAIRSGLARAAGGPMDA